MELRKYGYGYIPRALFEFYPVFTFLFQVSTPHIF